MHYQKLRQLKTFYAIIALFATTLGQAQVAPLFSSDAQERNTFLDKIKLEDNHGRLITDRNQKQQLLLQRLRHSDSIKSASEKLALTAVPMCSNYAFEEFGSGASPVLSHFAYTEGQIWNPIECQSLDGTANIGIPQYNPANSGLMSTTVPSNFIDPYMGAVGAFDQYVLKINHRDSYISTSKVQAKRFKTDNETQLKFNYKVVLQSIADNSHENEQPFLKVRVLTSGGAVVDEFCLIGDPTNCIFKEAESMEEDAIVLFTPNWQSGILDISSIPNNEEFTVEFMASRCGLGGHFGYAYIDDICLLHSDENLQGSIALDPLYKICPSLPVQVCGSFTVPNSGGITATIQSVTLDVRNASNAVVFTSAQPTLDMANKKFCFTLQAANFPDVANMGYNVSVSIRYGLAQTGCSGTSFDLATDDDANPGYDIWFLNCTNCPIALETASLYRCDTDKNGTETFNLQQFNPMVTANPTGLTFSYFTTVANAEADTNPITAQTAYVSESRTIFVRVSQSATCFKIIPVQVVVKNPSATISGILNVCSGNTVLSASPAASYLWSNGSTAQTITASAIGSYGVTVTDSYGCQSSTTVNIPASQVAAQPDIQVIQPGCFSALGTINVTSPAATYSFDGGATWGTSATLTDVAIGSYSVMIRTVMNCESYPVQVDVVSFLSPRPDVVADHPTYCGDTGSITISTPSASYSFDDGATWTTQNTMSGLPSGIYNVRVKDANGCISNYTSIELYGEFLGPPDYTSHNPYCGNAGSITIDTPAAEYSFDGGTTWQTSNTLIGIFAASYLVKIKNAQGCTSPHVYVYLTDLEYTYPEYEIVPAGCDTYGSVTITTPGDTYSFDGGLTWSTDPVMPNLGAPETFTVVVRKGACQSLYSYVGFSDYFLPLPVVNDYNPFVCDVLNDGTQLTDLSDWNPLLLPSVTGHTFRYFKSLAGAEGTGPSDEILNFASFAVTDGMEIFVRVTGPNGCSNVAKLLMNLLPTPVINMKDEYPLCKRSVVVIRAGAYDRYLWST